MANFTTNASGIIFSWRDLKLKSQYPGSVVPLAMFFLFLHIVTIRVMIIRKIVLIREVDDYRENITIRNCMMTLVDVI